LFLGSLSEALASAVLQFLGNKAPSGRVKKKAPAVIADSESSVANESSSTSTSTSRRPEDLYDLDDVCKSAIQVVENSQSMYSLMRKESMPNVEGRGVYLLNQPVSETKALAQKVEELEGAQALEQDRLVNVNKTIDSKFTELETLMKNLLAQSQTGSNKGSCKVDCKGGGCKNHDTNSGFLQKKSMENEKCFYCGRMGHFQADCEDLKSQIQSGNLKLNPEGKLRLRDGSFIPGFPTSATIKERVEKHYSRRPSQYYYGEYEDVDPVLPSKYSAQYMHVPEDAERRRTRLAKELDLLEKEEALELKRMKLEREEKRLEQSSGLSRSTNLLDVLGQLTEDEVAAIKAARSGFP
jgi:Zinc knuckle